MKKLLFISYYFRPFSGVGAVRTTYWADHFSEIRPDWKVTVVTATPQPSFQHLGEARIIHLPDSKRGIWSFFFKSDPGASWGEDLRKFILNSSENFDYVIFSGGPFLHFRVAHEIRRRWNSKVILDFRDPFSNNPRFHISTSFARLKQRILSRLERWLVSESDLVISVNPWCLGLINGIKRVPNVCIDNGFDESILGLLPQMPDLPRVSQGNKIKIVYAGSFAPDRNPSFLCQTLDSNPDLGKRFEFCHIGKESSILKPWRSKSWLIEMGQRSYLETVQIIRESDFGALFSLGHPFESTTKVFDYIALNKPFIIFSENIPQKGALSCYSSMVSGSEWIYNKPSSIAKFLSSLERPLPNSMSPDFLAKFSRHTGLKQLVMALEAL